MLHLTTGLAAALVLTGVAQAQPGGTIVIRDYFGTVEIDLSGEGAIAAAKSGPEAASVSITDGTVTTIDGGDPIDRRQWQRDYQNQRRGLRVMRGGADRDPAFGKMLEERPTVTISAPEGTSIMVEGSAIRLTGSGTAGRAEITDNIHLLVKLGDIAEGTLSVHGSGYMKVGNVAGMLDADVHGSGDLVAGNIREAELDVHGSGDLETENIGGRLAANVHGSGDLTVERVVGPVDASVHGSGDLDISLIERGFDGNVHGSGDLSVGSVRGGTVNANVHGSGDLDIDDGTVDALKAAVRGSGSFTFGGTAAEAVLRSTGSGSIRVGTVTGNIDADGKDIRVAGKKVGDDD